MIEIRRRTPRAALIVLTLSIVSASGPDESGSLPSSMVAKIDASVAKVREARKIPGLSVAIYDGRNLWSKGYGLADVENDIPATTKTVYRLASVSKPITAVAAMKLVEAGKLDLDAPVQKYVPSFPEKQWPVTCRDLLSHLAGIRSYRGEETQSTRHYLDRISALEIFRDDPLLHEPGTKYLYSTYGFNLVGAAVAKASGKRFLEVLKSSIFEVAGMRTIRDDDPYAIIPVRARGYRLVGGRLQNSIPADITNKVPGGGLCSDAPDVARFGAALIEGKILNPETMKRMWTPRKTKSGMPIGYALGWGIGRFRDEREVSHGGAQAKVSTVLYLRPDRKIVVVILANLEGVPLMDLARELADAVQPNGIPSTSVEAKPLKR